MQPTSSVVIKKVPKLLQKAPSVDHDKFFFNEDAWAYNILSKIYKSAHLRLGTGTERSTKGTQPVCTPLY